jgi:NAD(P)-dependent dehydrogenase (short-subunit alcohol dehydrogenase family)
VNAYDLNNKMVVITGGAGGIGRASFTCAASGRVVCGIGTSPSSCGVTLTAMAPTVSFQLVDVP